MSANGEESRAERLRRKARQDIRAGGRAARRSVSAAKRKGRQDLKSAERAARRKAAAVKQQAKQDLSAAEREARSTSARELLAGVAERVEVGEGERVEAPGSTREVVARAGDAAGVRSPMDASLDPGADGPALEQFAQASPMAEERQPEREGEQSDAAMLGEDFIAGGGGGESGFFGIESSDRDSEGDALEFDDAFDVTGEDDEGGFF